MLLVASAAVVTSSSSDYRVSASSPSSAPLAAFGYPPVLNRVRNDLLALTRRSTTRHILLPRSVGTDAVLTLKQNIRNRVSVTKQTKSTHTNTNKEEEEPKGEFIIDAFSSAAQRFSIDKDTASNGGLLGELVPQGYLSACPELDRASFTEPLGEICGPIESDFGYHLVLVCARTNCPKLDGVYTRVIRGDDGYSAKLAPPDGGEKSFEREVVEFSLGQIGFWIATAFAGGVVAELAANAAGVLETLPWEQQVPGLY